MGQSDSFIQEVSDEVRRDRLYHFTRRYGWLVALGLVAIVGTAGFLEWRKAGSQAEAEAAGDAIRAANLERDPEARAARLAALTGPSLVIARLAEAGSLREAGLDDKAAAVLAAIADDAAQPDLYRQMASLQRVMLLGSRMEPGERKATIETLVAEEAPFRPLALEQRALMALETGDKAAAIKDFQTILDIPGVPEQLAGRARQMIIAAGGTPANAG